MTAFTQSGANTWWKPFHRLNRSRQLYPRGST